MTLDHRSADSGVVRLRPSTYVTPVPGGLYCVGWQQTMTITGTPALGRLWEALHPHLHQGTDPDSLVAALPDGARPVATRLLDELARAGFLRRETPVSAHPPVTHPDHRRTLAFLDAASEDPAGAFATYRDTTVFIEGKGPLAIATAQALLLLGTSNVQFGDDVDLVELDAVAAGANARLLVGPPEPDKATARVVLLDPTGAAPFAEDPSARFNAPTPVSPVVEVAALDGRVLIGPARTSPDARGLRDVLQRMTARTSFDRRRPPVNRDGTVARLAGNLAALQLFYALTGVSTENDGLCLAVDGERLQTTAHPVWRQARPEPRPLAAHDAGVGLSPDEIGDVCDPLTGALPEPDPGNLPQSPLAVARAGTVRPGWADTGDVARFRAALAAAVDHTDRLLGDVPELLWELDAPADAAARAASWVTAGAGSDISTMLADAGTRMVARWLNDPFQRERRFVLDSTEVVSPVRDARQGEMACLRHDLAVVTDRPVRVEVLRPRTSPTIAAAVRVIDPEGRTLGVAFHDDVSLAWTLALRHATVVLQCGLLEEGLEPVPVIGTPSGASEQTHTMAASGQALAALALPHERLVAGVLTGDEPIDRLAVVGWLGLGQEERR